MDDILCCPVCGHTLKTIHLSRQLLHFIGKTADYAERRCSDNFNHVVIFWVDKKTKQVDLLKMSLKPDYTRFIEIDFVNLKCRITCRKDGEYEYIEIPKMIEPDFPDLVNLKERMSLYIVFS